MSLLHVGNITIHVSVYVAKMSMSHVDNITNIHVSVLPEKKMSKLHVGDMGIHVSVLCNKNVHVTC